jgi:DNA-binding protein Fis
MEDDRCLNKTGDNDLVPLRREALAMAVRDFCAGGKNDCAGKLYRGVIEAVEKPLIETALRKTQGNKIKAARFLGINRNTLSAKIRHLDIDAEKYR